MILFTKAPLYLAYYSLFWNANSLIYDKCPKNRVKCSCYNKRSLKNRGLWEYFLQLLSKLHKSALWFYFDTFKKLRYNYKCNRFCNRFETYWRYDMFNQSGNSVQSVQRIESFKLSVKSDSKSHKGGNLRRPASASIKELFYER